MINSIEFLIVEIFLLSNAHQKSKKKVLPSLRDIWPLFNFLEDFYETEHNYVYNNDCLKRSLWEVLMHSLQS